MISLCMIVKNEESVLKRCLDSVKEQLKNIVDDIVIVDTGSTDRTVEIAKNYDCRVFEFEWCNDFSKARNYSISKAKNDWVLILDADEYVDSVSINDFETILVNDSEKFRFIITIINIDEKGNKTALSKIARFFNRKNFEFQYNIHEQVMPKNGTEFSDVELDLVSKHTGYFAGTIKEKNKIENYKQMLIETLNNNPNDCYMLGHLGIIYQLNEEFEEAVKCLEKVVFNESCINTGSYTMFVTTYIKTLILMRQYELAVICERLWSYCSYDDNYVYLMGVAYAKSNRFENAIEALLICINWEGEMNNEKIYSYYLLGQIFEMFNEFEQAIICFENSKGYLDAEARLKKLKI